MPMSDFVERYQQLAKTHFAGLQIRHWPPNAPAGGAAVAAVGTAGERTHGPCKRRRGERRGRRSPPSAGRCSRRVVEGERGLKWTQAEMKGIKCPRNDKSFETRAPIKSGALKSKMTIKFPDIFRDDNVGAEFEIRYRYNGHCVRDVQIHNISTAPAAPLAGRDSGYTPTSSTPPSTSAATWPPWR